MNMSAVFAKCLFVVTESDSKEKKLECKENISNETYRELDGVVTEYKEEIDEVMESTELSQESNKFSPQELDFCE